MRQAGRNFPPYLVPQRVLIRWLQAVANTSQSQTGQSQTPDNRKPRTIANPGQAHAKSTERDTLRASVFVDHAETLSGCYADPIRLDDVVPQDQSDLAALPKLFRAQELQ